MLPVTVTLAGRRDHGAVPMARLAAPLALVVLGIACINLDVFTAPSAGTIQARLTGLLCAIGALATWTWYAVDNARYLRMNPRASSNLKCNTFASR